MPGGNNMLHLFDGRWAPVAGGAVRIAVEPDGSPWIADNMGAIFARVGTGWWRAPGAQAAYLVRGLGGIGGDAARDPGG